MAENKADFSWDPRKRIAKQVIIDDDNPDQMHIRWKQDVTAIVEGNKTLEELHEEKRGDQFLQYHIARLPLKIFMELDAVGITKDEKAFNKWLNDPDNRKWRVHKWRV